MADPSFQTNSLGWQVQQWNQQVTEWVELQLLQWAPDTSQLPEWTLTRPLSMLIVWGAAILLTVGIGLQGYRLVRPYLAQLNRQGRPAQGRSPIPPTDWLAQAETLHRQGDYALACRALYWAMLHRLDETQQLPRQDSRTDREYLNGVQTFVNPAPYQTLLAAHEQFWFGQVPLSAADFQRCWQAYQEIAAE